MGHYKILSSPFACLTPYKRLPIPPRSHKCRSFPACQLFFCRCFMVQIHCFCRTLKPSKSSHDFTLHLEINILMDAARIERAPKYQPFMCFHVEHSSRQPFRLTPVAGLSRLVSYFFAGPLWYGYTVFAGPLNHLHHVMAFTLHLKSIVFDGRGRSRTCILYFRPLAHA